LLVARQRRAPQKYFRRQRSWRSIPSAAQAADERKMKNEERRKQYLSSFVWFVVF
jgi:hypothetical protein